MAMAVARRLSRRLQFSGPSMNPSPSHIGGPHPLDPGRTPTLTPLSHSASFHRVRSQDSNFFHPARGPLPARGGSGKRLLDRAPGAEGTLAQVDPGLVAAAAAAASGGRDISEIIAILNEILEALQDPQTEKLIRYGLVIAGLGTLANFVSIFDMIEKWQLEKEEEKQEKRDRLARAEDTATLFQKLGKISSLFDKILKELVDE